WARSMPQPAGGCGSNIRSRGRANPGMRPGRATPTPGRPAVAQTGGPAPPIPRPTQRFGGPGNPGRGSAPSLAPEVNLYTNSAISYNPDTGAMNWFFQYTPGDMWDYDEVGTHILIDGNVSGEQRKLMTHSARNGFLYTMERANGAMVLAKPYTEVNWTKGVDQKTGKPLEYDPSKDIQTYAGIGNLNPNATPKQVCPSPGGEHNSY